MLHKIKRVKSYKNIQVDWSITNTKKLELNQKDKHESITKIKSKFQSFIKKNYEDSDVINNKDNKIEVC